MQDITSKDIEYMCTILPQSLLNKIGKRMSVYIIKNSSVITPELLDIMKKHMKIIKEQNESNETNKTNSD